MFSTVFHCPLSAVAFSARAPVRGALPTSHSACLFPPYPSLSPAPHAFAALLRLPNPPPFRQASFASRELAMGDYFALSNKVTPTMLFMLGYTLIFALLLRFLHQRSLGRRARATPTSNVTVVTPQSSKDCDVVAEVCPRPDALHPSNCLH